MMIIIRERGSRIKRDIEKIAFVFDNRNLT